MEYKLNLTFEAEEDLNSIVEYIAQNDFAAAHRFGSALLDCAKSLGKHPKIGIALKKRLGIRYIVHYPKNVNRNR